MRITLFVYTRFGVICSTVGKALELSCDSAKESISRL